MRPSWLTRLRDVRAESKRVERNKQEHVMSSLNTRRLGHEDSIAFTKSRIVSGSDSRARNAPFESDRSPESRDGGSMPFMIDCIRPDDDPFGLFKSLSVPATNDFANKGPSGRPGNHERRDESSKPSMTRNVGPCEDSDLSNDYMRGSFMLFLRSAPRDHDLVSVSSCNCVSNPLFEAEQPTAYQTEHGLCNNDTEECVITSDTSSSFCSETGSENSTLSSKCSWEDGEHHKDYKVCQEVDSLKRLLSSGAFDSNPDGSSCSPTENSGIGLKRSSSNGATKLISNVYHEITRGRPRLLSRAWSRRRVTAHACLINGHRGKTSSTVVDEKKGSCNEQVFGLANSILRHDMQGVMPKMCNDNAGENPPELGSILENHHDVVRNDRQVKISSSSYTRMRTYPEQLNQGSTERNSQAQYHTKPQRQRHVSMSAVLPPDLQGVVGDSIALVKVSENPYKDFHESIYEMIMEKDFEWSQDVEELLYCYLALNSPQHYELIEEVFSDVWSSILMDSR